MKINVLTNRYDNSRSGVNRSETALTTESVSPRTFGKIFARTVDGDLYAQPLIVSELPIGGKKRDVVYLATSRNWVYAYDAETPDEILPLWSRNLGVPVPRDEIVPGYLNFSGEIGMTSTPVIDLHEKGSGTIFVVAKTRTIEAGNKTIRYEIHALNILTGRDRRASSR
jgi:outer membrane protein assembly factor BamB